MEQALGLIVLILLFIAYHVYSLRKTLERELSEKRAKKRQEQQVKESDERLAKYE